MKLWRFSGPSGGNGTIKVVGHASSRTPNMSVERHLEVIFQKSQARANAVAQALIRAGIPADKVIVEAVGDSQPIYYEIHAQGRSRQPPRGDFCAGVRRDRRKPSKSILRIDLSAERGELKRAAGELSPPGSPLPRTHRIRDLHKSAGF